VCVCVCVCVCERESESKRVCVCAWVRINVNTHTHTHTSVFVCVYMFNMCIYVCVRMCIFTQRSYLRTSLLLMCLSTIISISIFCTSYSIGGVPIRTHRQCARASIVSPFWLKHSKRDLKSGEDLESALFFQVSFRKLAQNYRAHLRKICCKDKEKAHFRSLPFISIAFHLRFEVLKMKAWWQFKMGSAVCMYMMYACMHIYMYVSMFSYTSLRLLHHKTLLPVAYIDIDIDIDKDIYM